MKRQQMDRETLELEIATAIHVRECLRMAAMFGEPVGGYIAAETHKIAKFRKLLAAV